MPLIQNNKDNDFPLYLFHQGKNYEAGKFFGAHKSQDGKSWKFRVWAPRARSISVIGDFNEWERSANPMHRISETVWEAEVEGLKQFDAYKYSVETEDGRF
ncbi:MAG: 1,4-alpha-glucan branching enzyme, partial [Oscillospiraceae bacterium]|nr:1,4-alpha-glucan branching enzyme [Oscillospiraceae bacterium]